MAACVALAGCAAFRGPCSQSQTIVMAEGAAYVWTLGCGKDERRLATSDEIARLPLKEV